MRIFPDRISYHYLVAFLAALVLLGVTHSAPTPRAPQPTIQHVIAKPTPPKEPIPKESKFSQAVTKLYKHVRHPEAQRIVRLVFKYAKKHDISPTLALGLIAAESSFQSRAKSRVGAQGYTQVYPRWHQEKIAGRNILDPHVNIDVGMQILRNCLDRYRTVKSALGCYNGATTPTQINEYYTLVTQRRRQLVLAAL